MPDLDIIKGKNYQIIVFPNQEEGLKAQRILLSKDSDFKHISTLAVVVTEEDRMNVCSLLNREGINISGYYRFLYRDFEKDFFENASAYKPLKSEGEYLNSITLCYVAPCLADETKIRFLAYLSDDISEVLPYINAQMKSASYNKNMPALNYREGYRMITLYNIKIAVAKADDIIDAWKTIDKIKELVNETYKNKDKIKPNFEQKIKVNALEIFGYLPKSNCKICGEPTCLAYAMKLLAGEQKISACKTLLEDPAFKEKKEVLMNMLGDLGV